MKETWWDLYKIPFVLLSSAATMLFLAIWADRHTYIQCLDRGGQWKDTYVMDTSGTMPVYMGQRCHLAKSPSTTP